MEILPSTVCAIYKKAYLDLFNSVTCADSDEKKIQLITNFAKKYFLSQKDWEHANNMATNAHFSEYFQFISNASWQASRRLETQEKEMETNKWYKALVLQHSDYYRTANNIMKELIILPNPKLKSIFKLFEKFGAKPLTCKMKTNYEFALKLRNVDKKGGHDDKWLDLIKESKDKEIVADLLEARIKTFKHFINPKIWKYLIQFLRNQNNSDELLGIYQRYCRLFISDTQMRDEYRAEVEKSQKKVHENRIVNCWIDLIQLELDFGTINSAYLMLEKALKIIMNLNVSFVQKSRANFMQIFDDYIAAMRNYKNWCHSFRALHPTQQHHYPPKQCLYFKFDTYPQYANLPIPTFRWIFVQANAIVLNKLHQSCKYFFHFRPHPVYHRLVAFYFCMDMQFIDQSLFIPFGNIKNIQSANLVIGHSIIVYYPYNHNPHPSILSGILSMIKQCDAQFLKIRYQIITFIEFKILIISKKLKSMVLKDTKIMDSENNPLPKLVVKAFIKFFGNKNLACFNYR